MQDNESFTNSVNAVILCGEADKLSVLLIKRKHTPHAEEWALPGGMVKKNEEIETACFREIKKELGADLSKNEHYFLGERSRLGRDPRGKIKSSFFLFYFSSPSDFIGGAAGEGISECAWFPLLQLDKLAFDHGAVLCKALGTFWKFMPSGDSSYLQINLPNIFSPKKINLNEEVIFFGGTFNPWHDGHRACIKQCPNQNIVIIPDQNPWKKEEVRTSCYWEAYRNLCLINAKTPYAIYSGFFGMESSNPTASWFIDTKILKKSLLIGEDTFASFLDWYQLDLLLPSIYKIYITPRDCNLTETSKKKIMARLLEIAPTLEIEELSGHQFQNISSTQLRLKAHS